MAKSKAAQADEAKAVYDHNDPSEKPVVTPTIKKGWREKVAEEGPSKMDEPAIRIADDDDEADETPDYRNRGDDDEQSDAADTGAAAVDDADEEGSKATDFDDDLLDAAREIAGLTRGEAREFPSPEALRKALVRIRVAQKAADKGDVKSTERAATEAQKFLKRVKLDASTFDDGLVKAIDSLQDAIEEALGSVAKKTETAAERVSALESRDFAMTAERGFDAIKGEFASVIGTSPGDELDQNGKLFKNRVKIINEAYALESGYIQTQGKAPPFRTLMLRAARTLFPEVQKEQTRTELSSRLEDQKGRFVPRPGGSRKGPTDPRSRAETSVAKILARA